MNIQDIVLEHARKIGNDLACEYPAVLEPHPHINPKYVPELADAITSVVAEILQSFLNAGSERDVTFEELGLVIENHVRSWSDPS